MKRLALALHIVTIPCALLSMDQNPAALSEQAKQEARLWELTWRRRYPQRELLSNSDLAGILAKKLQIPDQASVEQEYDSEIEAIKEKYLLGIGFGRAVIEQFKEDIVLLPTKDQKRLPSLQTSAMWNIVINEFKNIEHTNPVIQAMLIEYFFTGAYLGSTMKFAPMSLLFCRTETTPIDEFQSRTQTTAGVSDEVLNKLAEVDTQKNTQLKEWFQNYNREFKSTFETPQATSWIQKIRNKLKV